MQNIKGGIFVLENLTSEDIEFLQYRANLSLDSSNGNIYRYLKEQEEEYLEKLKICHLKKHQELLKIYRQKEKN